MDDSDPFSAFFPDSTTPPDLYAVLSLPRTATPLSIKSAYRLCALSHHPDRLSPTSTPEEIAAANARFQQIGFAYAVLKDGERRERYDKTGRTDEGGTRSEEGWKEYFRELWKGEVNTETLEEFRSKYQGSEEEKMDLIMTYESSKGDFETILGAIMCSTVEDEDRFILLINAAISAGEIKATNAWKKALKDTKGKERRRVKASKEANEAEAYAKELGVHEKLYGKGKKGKGKKGKGKKDEAEDIEGLRALIQGNQAKRMGSVIDSIEAKYAAKEEAKKAKKAKKGEEGGKKRKVEVEPTEEEFEKIQKAMEERRNSKSGEPSKRRKS